MLFAQGNDGGLYLRDQRDPLNMAIMSGSVLYRISSYMAFMYKTHPFSLLPKKENFTSHKIKNLSPRRQSKLS